MAAEQTLSHRACAVGFSGALGVLVPAAAYIATMPFEGAHGLVAAGALPFAVGAVAGVGALAVSSHLMERRLGEGAEPAAEKSQEGSTDADAQESAGTRFAAQPKVKGVPIIARAAGAMDDDEAWAELDALLDENSPVSCDPTRSKDMYQIAIEELKRSQAGAEAEQPEESEEEFAVIGKHAKAKAEEAEAADDALAEEAGEPVAVAPAASSAPDSTDVYLMIAAARAEAQALQDAPSTQEEAPLGPVEQVLAVAEAEASARDEAISSLWDASASAQPVQEAVSERVQEGPERVRSAREGQVDMNPQDVWAAALAILSEPEPEPVVLEEDLRPQGTHFAQPGTPSTVWELAARSSSQLSFHDHVDELVEEEFGRMRTRGSRRSSRDYLHVVPGTPTAVLPRLIVEA